MRIKLNEAVFLWSKSSSINRKSKQFESKHKGVQEHNKYILEDYKNCLERNEVKSGANYSLRSNKHEISRAKQPKIALTTFDDK